MNTKYNMPLTAEYLIPCYTENCGAKFLIQYHLSTPNTKQHWTVNLWAVGAERGNEYESMRATLGREKIRFENAAHQHPTNRTLANGARYMAKMKSQMESLGMHKQPEAELQAKAEQAIKVMKIGDFDMKYAVYLCGAKER